MKALAYLNTYLLKYKWRLFAGIVFVFLSNYFRVLQPQMIREGLDLVISNLQLYRSFDGFDNQALMFNQLGTSLLYFGLLVLLLALLMGVFMYFMRQTIVVMSRLIEFDLKEEIFSKYEALDLAFYKRNNTGDLMARITEDVSKVRNYLGPCILYSINLVSLFVLVISAMLSVNVKLTLYSLAPLPLLSISIYYVSTTINKRSEIIQKQLARLNSIAQEVYSGIRVVKSYVQEPAMLAHFKTESDDYREKSLHLAKVDASFFPVMLLMIGASTIITVYVGGLQVADGTLTAGNIAEFVIYVNMLTWPVTAIGWIASLTQQASASQERINEFLNASPTITNPTESETPINGDILFDDVSFTYPDTGIEALKNVSFHLRKGQKMAIIGRTGSGKTTIADLLVRMYDTTSGKIEIGGQSIDALNLNLLRSRIGYVPQDVFLFSDAVSTNIAFGKPDATQAEIEAFAKYAAVHQDIMDLPKGYDTVVGERGVTLSGGQKQRVSIARAMIKRPEILLLDDCLSAVDTKTEQTILGYLNEELADKTAILITHRIYNYLTFDHIIVLDQGRIIEEGTHNELIANRGYYFEQYEKQIGETVGDK